MPVYDFIAPEGAATHKYASEIARAVTKVHTDVTNAPAAYAHCSFTTMRAGTMFLAGEETTSARMIGIIRAGRSASLRARLIHGIADAWSKITGEPKGQLAILLHELPGSNCFEYGEIMREASEDPGAISK